MGISPVALYHVWSATKSRKWLLPGEIKGAAEEMVAEVAAEKGIKLLECAAMVDHMHFLLDVETREALSKAMNLLKGASSRRLFQRFPEMKLDAGVTSFWQHRYAWKMVPPSAEASVRRYIKSQWERPEKYER